MSSSLEHDQRGGIAYPSRKGPETTNDLFFFPENMKTSDA